jgi:YbbR domain-containing protein
LGEGLLLVGDDKTVVVNIRVEKASTKEISIWPGDIEIRNRPTDMEIAFLTTGPINVMVVGPSDELKEITRNSMKPYIDLKDYTYGTYAVKLQMEAGTFVTLAENQNVSIYLSSEGQQ